MDDGDDGGDDDDGRLCKQVVERGSFDVPDLPALLPHVAADLDMSRTMHNPN